MHKMTVYVKQRRAIFLLSNDVAAPEFVVKGPLRHESLPGRSVVKRENVITTGHGRAAMAATASAPFTLSQTIVTLPVQVCDLKTNVMQFDTYLHLLADALGEAQLPVNPGWTRAAEIVLHMLGLSQTEAARVARLPLPPVELPPPLSD